ncbi:MAG: hypothetical protein ABI068_05340 [Ktedonobacterales bacterium]
MLLAGCGSVTATGQTTTPAMPPNAKLSFNGGYSAAHPYPFATVRFVKGTSYEAALTAITDLGLRPLSPCYASDALWASAGQRNTYSSGTAYAPGFWVNGAHERGAGSYSPLDYDPLAPDDWLQRLATLPAVAHVEDSNMVCPMIPASGSTPCAGSYLDPSVLKAPTYLHVSFAAGMSYAQAVATVSNLGFRLADPCYEQAKPTPAWHAMGQETGYATSDSLTLALTDANATLWRQQLSKAASVTGFSVLPGNGCSR